MPQNKSKSYLLAYTTYFSGEKKQKKERKKKVFTFSLKKKEYGGEGEVEKEEKQKEEVVKDAEDAVLLVKVYIVKKAAGMYFSSIFL